MKFRAHETFFIRKGWLYKGLKNVLDQPSVFTNKEKNPVDVLGIGSNMVKSLRYWLQATGLTEEKLVNNSKGRAKEQRLTKIGEIVFKNDKYFEESGSICLIHYFLASNYELAPSWYYFFNEFEISEFNREDFVIGIQKFSSMKGENPAKSSLEDDFNCLINSYVLRKKLNPTRVNPESNIECPLDELGLIEISDVSKGKDRIFKKSSLNNSCLNPYILYAIILDQYPEKNEIRISDLLTAPNNIGKIFNLNILSLSKALDVMEKMRFIDVIRTSGLDVIRIKKRRTFEECIEAYYKSLNGK